MGDKLLISSFFSIRTFMYSVVWEQHICIQRVVPAKIPKNASTCVFLCVFILNHLIVFEEWQLEEVKKLYLVLRYQCMPSAFYVLISSTELLCHTKTSFLFTNLFCKSMKISSSTTFPVQWKDILCWCVLSKITRKQYF